MRLRIEYSCTYFIASSNFRNRIELSVIDALRWRIFDARQYAMPQRFLENNAIFETKIGDKETRRATNITLLYSYKFYFYFFSVRVIVK